jgi:isopentenyl phosphate kinase
VFANLNNLDFIAPTLANGLGASRLVFVSRHAVHVADPREDLLAPVVCELFLDDHSIVLGSSNNDVSGAMFGKVQSIRELVRPDIVTVICTVDHAVEALIGLLPSSNFAFKIFVFLLQNE